jgi:hypothetical protein
LRWKIFDGVEPEAAKREPTLGGCGIRRTVGRVKGELTIRHYEEFSGRL